MEDKKIDRLFQEKLRELEVPPKAVVWKKIEAKLKKKKRRAIPFWWLSGGTAAVIILSLLLFPLKEKNRPIVPQKIERITDAPTKKGEQPTSVEESPKDFIIKEKSNTETIIANKKIVNDKIAAPYKKNLNKQSSTENNSIVAINKNIENRDDEHNEFLKKENSLDKIVKENNKETLKKGSIKTINKELITKKDLVAEVSKKDSAKTKEKNINKWSIAPVLALVNSNSFTQASPIDESLNTSITSGNNSLSYGVKITYQLNDKWSIQSGIHLQEMSFSTENLFIVSGANGNNFPTINYSNNELASNTPILIGSSSLSSDALASNGVNLIDNNASLDQTYSYIEIPFEAKYRIINNKKFDTNIVAGFSSLFLRTNEVKVKSSIFSSVLGEANNLNTVNFSSNVGLDFNYSLTRKLKISLTPMFKVQLNTFSNDSNGFKPYYFGVYTGLNFRF